MFERLLIPVDGSTCAQYAAKHGLELADRYGATGEAIYVGDDDADGQAILDTVDDMAETVGTTVETTLLQGNPAKRIAERAAERDHDLIVMGRCGRAGVTEVVLGSVTERVLRRTDVPVLTVPDEDLAGATGVEYGSVLVTTDGSEIADRAGPYGADIARRFDAALHVLNAVDVQASAGVFDAGGVGEEYIDRLESEGEKAVDRLVEDIDSAELDVHRAVVRGAAREVIQEYVDDHGIDLVVMSSEGQSNLAKQRIGTVAGQVLRSLDVPVLVVPEA
nr:universal stress protein [Haloplanus sp. XH21]